MRRLLLRCPLDVDDANDDDLKFVFQNMQEVVPALRDYTYLPSHYTKIEIGGGMWSYSYVVFLKQF